MGEAWAAHLKSLVDGQQSVIYTVTFDQYFMASTHSFSFQGQVDRGLIYGPNHSGETQLNKQEVDVHGEQGKFFKFNWCMHVAGIGLLRLYKMLN